MLKDGALDDAFKVLRFEPAEVMLPVLRQSVDGLLAAREVDDIQYGVPRLLACFLVPSLLAKASRARGRRYVEAHLWLDMASLLANVAIDRGPREALRRLPEEMALWPPRRRRRDARSWWMLAGAAVISAVVTVRLTRVLDRASQHPNGRVLNWTPLDVGWSPPDGLSMFRLLYLIPLAVFAEETYIRGLLWSRMAWLGRWRPLSSGAAWAAYHLNQPVKNILGSILPGALLASYTREMTGNIYWTAAGHYLSNTYGAWSSGRQRRDLGD